MTKAAGKAAGGGQGSGSAIRRKLTQGRKKIAMERIENTNALQVCFSKRRKGLEKKALELSLLCGAEVALVVFSPAGKPYGFGHASVHAVIDRLLDPSSYDAEAAAAAAAARQPELHWLMGQVEHLKEAVEAAERRRRELDQEMRAAGVWIGGDVQGWGLPDLEAALAALEGVQAEAAERAHDQILAEEAMVQCAGGGAGDGLLGYLGSGSVTADDGTGSQEVAMDTTMQLMGRGAGGLLSYLGSGSFTADAGTGSHEAATNTTMQLMGRGAGGLLSYLGSGSFTADAGTGSHEAATDTTMQLMGGGAGGLLGYLGSGSFTTDDGTGSHEVAMGTMMQLMGRGAGNLFDYLGSVPFTADNGTGSNEVAIDTKVNLMGGGAGSLFHYLGSGPFIADGTGSHEVAIDTKVNVMGSNVSHALAPMMTLPPPSLPPPFNHGLGYNNLSAGYGYNHDDGDNHGHGQMGWVYGTTCNYFG